MGRKRGGRGEGGKGGRKEERGYGVKKEAAQDSQRGLQDHWKRENLGRRTS